MAGIDIVDDNLVDDSEDLHRLPQPEPGICAISEWAVEADVHEIDILPDGDVIAACGREGLLVYGHDDVESGQKKQHPISEMCKDKIHVQGVYVASNKTTIAAVEWIINNHSGFLHIYTSVNGRWEQKTYNTRERPLCVACTGDGHCIIGTKTLLSKRNSHGQPIWEKKLSLYPEFISIDHTNRILVSNTGGGCVTVYNEDGVEMFSFPAATDQRKLKPRGLCVDDEDNILVLDGDSESVLMYNPSGQFLKKLVDADKGSCCVALYKDIYLVVGGNRKLRLYKLHVNVD